MAVYVDDMREPYGRMIMCHMLADTDEELHEMARKIGVARKWHQKPGTTHSHYDVCMSMRAKAVKLGAIEINRNQLAEILKARRVLQAATEAAKKALCELCGKPWSEHEFGVPAPECP